MLEYHCWPGALVNPDRRRSQKYPFLATAEIIHEGSRSVITTRLADLSLHGWYLDMYNPPPKGTTITVRIVAGSTVFQSAGKIVYCQVNLGAGVEFENVEQRYLAALEVGYGTQAVKARLAPPKAQVAQRHC